MKSIRFNPFAQIHKGLRALLYDTALMLQHTNFTVEEETAAAVDRVKLVTTLFEHHAHVEDSQLFPLIEPYAPQIVDDFESQHQIDHELSHKLEACIARFTDSNTDAQNIWAGSELCHSFHSFLAFNVEHMKKEETIINECLWRYYSDEDLLRKVQEISGSVPPDQNRHFVFWMLKGMARHEIINWYNTIKLSAPPPVFAFFCDLAEDALPSASWNAVKEALQEGALLA
ncbi:MAG TPA: hemerythrin domain-containing protein [Flavisolibacter sp.]|nr:hemerythrin domain-containing protein [Flavisolibacter sp.]